MRNKIVWRDVTGKNFIEWDDVNKTYWFIDKERDIKPFFYSKQKNKN